MATVCIIPARGGSVRLPRKNLRMVAGMTLISRAVETALSANLVDEVIVSTDCGEIKSHATYRGAMVVDRPGDLAADDSHNDDAIIHAAHHMKLGDGDHIVQMQCTSPLTTWKDIDAVAELVQRSDVDSVRTVSRLRHSLWLCRLAGDGWVEPLTFRLDEQIPNSQSMPTQYKLNGALQAEGASDLYEHGCSLFGYVAAYVMPEERTLDVDTENDLARAEIMITTRRTVSI